MSTKTTYVLSKEEIVSKLESLHFSFEEHHWESFQQSFQEVKVQQPAVATPKFSAKLIAIPAFVAVAGLIVYFSVNKLQSQNSTDDTKVNIQAASMDPVPKKSETNPDAGKTENTIAATQAETKPNTAETKPTTAETKAVITPKPVFTQPVQTASVATTPANTNAAATTAKLNQSATTVPATSTTGTSMQQQTAKKYYNYKRKQDTKTVPEPLVPSPGEDDVVVPQGDAGTSEN